MASTGAATHRGGRLVRSSRLGDSPVTSGLRQSSGTANSRQNPACASSMTTLCPGRAPISNQAMFAASRVPRLAIWNRRGSSWRLRRRIMDLPAKDSAPGSHARSAMIPRVEEARNWPGRARAGRRQAGAAGAVRVRPGRAGALATARPRAAGSMTAARRMAAPPDRSRSRWAKQARLPRLRPKRLGQRCLAARPSSWRNGATRLGAAPGPGCTAPRRGRVFDRPDACGAQGGAGGVPPRLCEGHNHNFVCVRYLMSLYL